MVNRRLRYVLTLGYLGCAAAFKPSGPTQQRSRALAKLQLSSREVRAETQGSSYDTTSSVTKSVVATVTLGLNAITGARSSRAPAPAVSPAAALSPASLLAKIRKDYNEAYFLTGRISDEAYHPDCVFTDPTLSFTGLDTWKGNIRSLMLFIREPKLRLKDIKLDPKTKTITTQWTLLCELALPWRPVIEVDGGTVHRYDSARGGRVVEHLESWQVSVVEAISQIFRPGRSGAASSLSFSGLARSSSFLLRLLPMTLGLGGSGLMVNQQIGAAYAAEGTRQIGEIPTSGLFFKDTLDVYAFKDPKVEGVTLYVSDFQRPLTERLANNFFSDPSQASLTCVRTGPIKFGKIDTSRAGEEVFSEARSLLFKTIKVRRIYDPQAKSLVYISFSTRLAKNDDDNKSRFKSSLCAVPLDIDTSDSETAPPTAP